MAIMVTECIPDRFHTQPMSKSEVALHILRYSFGTQAYQKRLSIQKQRFRTVGVTLYMQRNTRGNLVCCVYLDSEIENRVNLKFNL